MRRRWFIVSASILFLLGLWILGAKPEDLIPNEGGRKLATEFLKASLTPAFDYEDISSRGGEVSFLEKTGKALWLTIRYAAISMSLALIIGIIGGVLGSSAWWTHPSTFLQTLRIAARLFATAIRSVHELMWALLFLAAVGTTPAAAIFAIALPYGGTLAKVFSELLDEAPSSTAEVMKASGSSGLAAFLTTAARAFPDLMTYALYRLECAVRSSAVLGFVGIPTLGYEIMTSFEDGHYREIWTYLYALLAIVILFEWWGAQTRKRLSKGSPSKALTTADTPVETLWKSRGRSRFLQLTGITIALMAIVAWSTESQWGSQLTASQRFENFQRFIGEIVPYPIRESGDWSLFSRWLHELLIWDGMKAVWQTFHLGTVAILLAGASALAGILYGARSLANCTPRGIPVCEGRWRSVLGYALRTGAVISRAMPEFILAFLLLGIFGPTMWALIFPLAIHNGGILLRLGAEVIDNAPSSQSEITLAQGGSRASAFLTALLPENFARLILFLFYRWETCIREATILGMLGVSSLGALISESRAGFFYDEMVLWITLGAILVFLGDLASNALRANLRKKS